MMGFLSNLFRRQEPVLGEARARDAAALATMHARAFRHAWSESEFERLLAEPHTVCHVARGNGGAGPIAGFVLSRRIDHEAEILMVAVSPSEQGRGLARQLVARHLGRLAAQGTKHVFLEVDEGNRPALSLYASAGFVEVGRRPRYYEGPGGAAAALIMRRNLD
jgi:[ribosomal protein S18]-alanine N-acetyltransferase